MGVFWSLKKLDDRFHLSVKKLTTSKNARKSVTQAEIVTQENVRRSCKTDSGVSENIQPPASSECVALEGKFSQ